MRGASPSPAGPGRPEPANLLGERLDRQRLAVGWTWGEPAIGHRHHALARIGPMLATIIACTRGQVLACLAPVASAWHPCQRGPGSDLSGFAGMLGISPLLDRQC